MSEIEPIEITSVASPVSDKKPEREGLPSSYRMRADAHYVDQLTSRRADRLALDASRTESPSRPDYGPRPDGGLRPDGPYRSETGRTEVNSKPEASAKPETGTRMDTRRTDVINRDVAADPPHRRGDRVLAQLSQDIATIQSAATILAGESSPVARRVSVNLIRSHAWRAAWLFRAHQILEALHRAHVRPRPIGPILNQIRESLTPECRLSGSSLTVHASDWNAMVDVDEESLITGIAGAVLATLGFAGGADGLAIKVTATIAEGELRTIEVTQDAVQVGATLGNRFLDPSWVDRPGGWTASLGATVAKSVAHLADGETVFLAGEKRGSTVRFTFRSQRT